MDSTNIDLPRSMVHSVQVDGNHIQIRLEPAYLLKTMTGSDERTLWTQNAVLHFENAQLSAALPKLPAACVGGDVGENVFTYRDMIPVPLESRGRAHCTLKVENDDNTLQIQAEAVKLELEAVAKYVKHLRPGDADYQ